jgi:hypothetical protein
MFAAVRQAARLDADPGSGPGSGNQRLLNGDAVTPWIKIETARQAKAVQTTTFASAELTTLAPGMIAA